MQSPCAPPTRVYAIEQRVNVDSRDTEYTLNCTLRTTLYVTVAPSGTQGKDTKGRVGDIIEAGAENEVRKKEERSRARANVAVFLAATPEGHQTCPA